MAHTALDDRPKYLGHHYDSVEQQFQSGKLGMWLFLSTEILLFAGLFCAYAVYRHNHPEIFLYAHHFLDKKLGGLNTIVLIFSSLTMAIGVRCAQKGQRGLLILMLGITFLCACTFLGVKYIEYSHKWKHGLLWGTRYRDQEAAHGAGGAHDAAAGHEAGSAPATGAAHEGGADGADGAGGGAAGGAAGGEHEAAGTVSLVSSSAHGGAPVTILIADAKAAIEAAKAAAAHDAAGADGGVSDAGSSESSAAHGTTAAPAHGAVTAPAGPIEHSLLPHAAPPPPGLAPDVAAVEHAGAPSNVQIFFGIYFVMTGLHGLHVIIGMIVIAWLMIRAYKGHFGPDYFTPVDLGGLYWHIVDLIWIYLFPLLYLIH